MVLFFEGKMQSLGFINILLVYFVCFLVLGSMAWLFMHGATLGWCR